jgi:hypothetical protein
MVRLYTLLVTSMLLAGCVISTRAIRPDGVLVVEILKPGVFLVDKQVYYESAMWFSLSRLQRSPDFKAVEVRIPSSLLQKNDNGASCGQLAAVVASTAKEWRFYEWTPNDESTKKPILCDVAVLG